ncbi:MAG: hypothetical protein HY704_06935 [Gemmatimonadetes bacterium]|nr:hypothetical protein [Gemmatimonadota bacterium]
MTRRLGVCAMLASAGLLTGWGLQEGPAAIVVRLSGQVQVQPAGGSPQPATVGMRLNAGDRVSPASGASVAVLRKTGEKLTITQPTVIGDAGGASDEAVFSKTIRALAQVSNTSARNQPNRQGMIRPIPGTAVPVAPRNGILVIGPRPTFRWFAVPGAKGYRIQIQKVGGQPERYEAGTDTAWTLPADAPALEPGQTYRWTVAPVPSGRAAPLVSFRVLGAAEHEALQRTLADLAAVGFEPEGDGLLLAALAYRDAGLYYEVERLLERMAKSNVPLGRDFYYLQGEVYDALGKLEAARAAFDKADAMSP